MFSSVARLILLSLDKAAAKAAENAAIPVIPEPPNPIVESIPSLRRKLPPPRDALSLDSYNGPMEGELHWSGRIKGHGAIVIQGGQANTGELTGDLPRVPVTVEVISGNATPIVPPASHNKWDHMTLLSVSAAPVDSVVIRWKVKK
jgi:hypothetical protein